MNWIEKIIATMQRIRYFNQQVMKWSSVLSTPFLLLSRLWVAWVFFKSGLLKLSQWDSTLYLFEYEYQVPLLSPLISAYLATSVELGLPILLMIGLFTRITALGLFMFNIMAVIASPVLWEQGFVDHQLWGVILATLVIWGGGWVSLDRWIRQYSQKMSNDQGL